MKRKGRQTNLSDGLAALSRSFDRQSRGGFLQVRIADEWDAVAGERVALHTCGVHLRSGELVVRVDSQAWATELAALAGPYQEALNTALGQNLVRSVRFTVSREVRERRSRARQEERREAFYAPDEGERVPLTAEERAEVEASIPDLGNEELRQAALRATIAGLEWEKGRKALKSSERPPERL